MICGVSINMKFHTRLNCIFGVEILVLSTYITIIRFKFIDNLNSVNYFSQISHITQRIMSAAHFMSDALTFIFMIFTTTQWPWMNTSVTTFIVLKTKTWQTSRIRAHFHKTGSFIFLITLLKKKVQLGDIIFKKAAIN